MITQSQKPIELSICISTRNRCQYIGATLDTIIPQITDDCEIVVLDGASTDNTSQIVSEYAERCRQLRYVRLDENHGIDQDYDLTVGSARGKYCWLTADDDFMKPGAINAVLSALRRGFCLVIVNTEVCDVT